MLDLDRLAKVWRLTTSPNAGEAAAARERARVMVEREGKTLADVPALLRGTSHAPPEPGPGGFAFYDMSNPAHMAAYAEQDRRRRTERARKEAPERAEVLARYGGTLEAVLAWTRQEQLLRDAVAQWSEPCPPPHERWTSTVDGCHRETFTDLPAHVVEALSAACPLPTSITEAAAECAMWERRERDLGLALEDTADSQLDLPAYMRRDIVRRLLETGLRATSLGEVLIRQQHLVDSQMTEPKVEKAVLADLEALVAAEASVAPGSRPGAREASHSRD